TVRVVEHPEQSELESGEMRGPTGGAVQPALAELRLTLGAEVPEASITFENGEYGAHRRERALERIWLQEAQVVRGGVVLGILAVRRTHETAHGQVEPRRAVLPLVVAVGDEVGDGVRPRVPQDMGDGAIDRRIAPAGAFVREGPRIADAREHQSMLDVRHDVFVTREPGDG